MEDLERQSLKELEELKDGLMNEINSITKYSINSKLSWLSIRDVFFDPSRNEFFTIDGMKRIYLLEIKDKTTGESIFKNDNKPLSERSISHVKESYEFYQKVLDRLKAIKEEIFKKTFGFYPGAKKEEDNENIVRTKVAYVRGDFDKYLKKLLPSHEDKLKENYTDNEIKKVASTIFKKMTEFIDLDYYQNKKGKNGIEKEKAIINNFAREIRKYMRNKFPKLKKVKEVRLNKPKKKMNFYKSKYNDDVNFNRPVSLQSKKIPGY